MVEFISKAQKSGTPMVGALMTCYDESWVTVSTGADIDALSVLTLTVDYTIQFNRNFTGFQVFFVTPVTRDWFIKVRRDVPLLRHFTDFDLGGHTGLNTTQQLNKESEYLKLMMDDINEDIEKRVSGNFNTQTSFNYRLIDPEDGKLIGWAASGMDNLTV